MGMTLFLNAINSDGEHREFNCSIESLEDVFNFLNFVVTEKTTLLSVHLLDKNGLTELPVAAFDGIPVSLGFEILKKEWELVLANPPPVTATHYQQVLALVSRQRINCVQRVASLEKMIARYHSWMQRTQEGCSVEKTRTKLLNTYQTQLERHQSQLEVTRFKAALLTKRLNQLMGHTL